MNKYFKKKSFKIDTPTSLLFCGIVVKKLVDIMLLVCSENLDVYNNMMDKFNPEVAIVRKLTEEEFDFLKGCIGNE